MITLAEETMQALHKEADKKPKVRTANASLQYYHQSKSDWLNGTIEDTAPGESFPGSELLEVGKEASFVVDKYSFDVTNEEIKEFTDNELGVLLKESTSIISVDGYTPPKENAKYQQQNPNKIPGFFHVCGIKRPSL